MDLAVQDWLSLWESQINAQDYVAARALFAEDVCAFGSLSGLMQGRDALEVLQWRRIWGTIRDFRFEQQTGVTRTLGAGWLVLLRWSSQGRDGGGWYPRRGRATIILEARVGGLACIHSHNIMTAVQQ